MPAWDIDPVGVQGVVEQTSGVAEELEPVFTNYGTALQGSAENCSSEIVALALQGYAEHAEPDLRFVAERTMASLTACVNATNAYVQGDLEMAANAQASATAAPDGRFSGAGGGPVPQ